MLQNEFCNTSALRFIVFVFFERNGAVEDEMFGSGIGVDVVVSRASELQIGECRESLHEFLHKRLLVHTDAIGVEEGAHSFYATNAIFFFVLLDGITRIFARPKASIVAHLSGQAVVTAQPVDGTLYLRFAPSVPAFEVGS